MSASVKSAVRVLDLLEYFDRIERPASVGDIARGLDWPQSSTSMLVASLVSCGYLAYATDGRRLRPTARVSLLGRWIDTRVADDRVAGLMADLSAATGETVLLGTLSDITCIYVEVVPATRAMRLHIPRGTTRPIAASGMGLLLLSALDDTAIAARLDRIGRLAPPGITAVQRKAVMAEVETIRRTGFAISIDRVVVGAGVVCVLLPDAGSSPPLGVGLGGQSAVIRQQQASLVALLHAKVGRWMT